MAKDDDSSLAQRIVSLKAELELVTQDIVSHVSSLYNPENDAATNLKNDPRNAIKVLQHEVLDCLETAQERGAYRERFAADVEQCRTLMDTISQVASASDKVVRCDEAVGGADLQLARKLLAEVRQALDALPAPNTEVGTGAVCRVLRREARLLNARFHAKLRRLLSNCIVCECGRLSVTKRLKGMLRGGGEEMILDVGIELADIWACLVSIDSAEESVRGVVDSVWQAVLKPLWRERRAQAPHVVLGDEHSELVFDSVVRDHSLSAAGGGGGGGAGAVLPGACRMPLPQLLEQIGQVWSFVATEVFTGHVEVVALAAAQLEPAGALPLVPVLVDTLTALVPKSEGELAGFQRAAEKASKDLEAKLSALGLLQGSDSFSSSSSSSSSSSRSRSPRLSDSVSELRHRFADMRRKEILGRGRDLLLSDYHNTMVAAGDASEDEPSSAGNVGDPTAMLEHSGSVSLKTLQFESCQVSLAACRVLKLVHEVMRQACQSGTSPSLATMLYQSARDCLELFLAIVPVRFADVIDTVPRMGAVLYNDCCYVAHNCTLITHAYKADLTKIDPTLSDSAGFIDFIPRFRALGEKCLAGHLDEQRATLGELVARVRVSPASERSKKQGSVSAGMLAPRVVGAVGMVGAAVGGALLKQIGTLSGVGGGGGGGGGGLTLSGALQEAANAHGHGHPPTAPAPAHSDAGGHENDEESAALVVRHMERLRGQWQGVLQDVVYERAVGYLLEGVLRALMLPVLEADCITESAGGDISRVFRVIQRARAVFPSAAAGGVGGSSNSSSGSGGGGSGGGAAGDDDVLGKAAASWSKFCALTDLIEYSLSEVAEWLPRRKFAAFTGSEMTGLIKALFEDSPRRQGILKSILEMTS